MRCLTVLRSLWHLQEALGCFKYCSSEQRGLQSNLWDLLSKESHQADSHVLCSLTSVSCNCLIYKSGCDAHGYNLSTGSRLILAVRSLFRPGLPADVQLKTRWSLWALRLCGFQSEPTRQAVLAGSWVVTWHKRKDVGSNCFNCILNLYVLL